MKTRIKRILTYLFTAFIVLQPVFVYSSQGDFSQLDNQKPQSLPMVKAKLAGKEFNIMLARTDLQKAKGFMYYSSIQKDVGMLFIYSHSQKMSFWMKNTRVPLDVVFISDSLEVTEWIENMTPGYMKSDSSLRQYNSKGYAKYALELKAGTVKELGLKVGDKLDIPKWVLYIK